MTIYPTFFTDDVQIVRFDGHAANDYVPLGTNIDMEWLAADVSVRTQAAPAGAVAFYLSINNGTSGTIRFTIDGVTNPTANIGFSSTGGMVPINIGIGSNMRIVSTGHSTAAYANLQWLGSV